MRLHEQTNEKTRMLLFSEKALYLILFFDSSHHFLYIQIYRMFVFNSLYFNFQSNYLSTRFLYSITHICIFHLSVKFVWVAHFVQNLFYLILVRLVAAIHLLNKDFNQHSLQHCLKYSPTQELIIAQVVAWNQKEHQ